jgi:hypothetical protein
MMHARWAALAGAFLLLFGATANADKCVDCLGGAGSNADDSRVDKYV